MGKDRTTSFSSSACSVYSHVQCKEVVVVVVVVEPSLTNQLPFFLPLSSKAPRLERKLILSHLCHSGVGDCDWSFPVSSVKKKCNFLKTARAFVTIFFYNLVWGISRKKRITILKFNTLPHPGLMAGARYAKGGQILITNPLLCLHMCKKYI